MTLGIYDAYSWLDECHSDWIWFLQMYEEQRELYVCPKDVVIMDEWKSSS